MTKFQNRFGLIPESLEPRMMLDGGLASEFVAYESQDELKSDLIEQAVSRNANLLGETVEEWWWFDCFNCFGGGGGDFDFVNGGPIAPPSVDPPAGDLAPEANVDSSDTNTQVDGVDEGDLIETDGNYVYLLSQNKLTIVDVRTAEHPRVASRVDLASAGQATEIYLHEDRLMVISTQYGYFNDAIEPLPLAPAIDIGFAPSLWLPPREVVTATVIDVANREAPQIVSETEIDGWAGNTRAIDGKAYLVIQDGLDFPQPLRWEVDTTEEELDVETDPDGDILIPFPQPFRAVQYETEVDYRARIEPLILDLLPQYATFDANGLEVASGELTEYSSIYNNTDPDAWSMISVVTIDMHADLPTVKDSTTVLSASSSEIFMSGDSLYVFQPVWDQVGQTSILKFDVFADEGTVEPVAAGRVPGQMLNQFSADEFFGDLRIATTSWDAASTSGVYVMEQSGDEMLIKGKVDGLAPGERIYSVRFLNYRAYVVTFRQTDPLFAINMIDPENPVVEGELKIPGFSEYLMPIGEDHLLGIGRDADPNTGRFEELQISLFDVSDMTDPQLQDRYSFEGGRNAWSLAQSDHHAVGYYGSYDTLAIPVSDWSKDAANQHALHVFRVDTETGIEFVEAIAHPSEVLRSVRVEDALISVSNDTLKVNSIETPAELVGQLHYLPPRVGSVVPKEPTAVDIDRVFDQAAAGTNPARFDMDGNALVNNDDVTFLLETVFRSDYGDTDLDGKVDFSDFLQLSLNFGNEGGWADGDFDGDGLVGFSDFTSLAENFGA